MHFGRHLIQSRMEVIRKKATVMRIKGNIIVKNETTKQGVACSAAFEKKHLTGRNLLDDGGRKVVDPGVEAESRQLFELKQVVNDLRCRRTISSDLGIESSA